jgi:hypothetical protein
VLVIALLAAHHAERAIVTFGTMTAAIGFGAHWTKWRAGNRR